MLSVEYEGEAETEACLNLLVARWQGWQQ